MITVEEMKQFRKLENEYLKTRNFEDILDKALNYNETAFDETMQKAEEYNEWKYYSNIITSQCKHMDIVEIGKI